MVSNHIVSQIVDTSLLTPQLQTETWTLLPGKVYTGIYAYRYDGEIHYIQPNYTKVGMFTFTVDEKTEMTQEELQKTAWEKRIKKQVNTSALKVKTIMTVVGQDPDGNTLTDHEIHKMIEREGFNRVKYDHSTANEWFNIPADELERILMNAVKGTTTPSTTHKKQKITLRKEQRAASNKMTKAYYAARDKSGHKSFVLNAKMRFGKTVTAYDFIRKIDADKIMIITHRPSTISSWADDLFKMFDAENTQLITRNSINDHPSYSWEEYDPSKRNIIYVSLQDARQKDQQIENTKGISYEAAEKVEQISKEDAQNFKKRNADIFSTVDFDVVFVDESHEGTETDLAKDVFDAINTDFTVYLSGTDFARSTDENLPEENIFTWTYTDEQYAKRKHAMDYPGEFNPYASLPEIRLNALNIEDILNSENIEQKITDNSYFSFRKFFEIDPATIDEDHPEKAEFTDIAQHNVETMLEWLVGVSEKGFDKRKEDSERNAFVPFGRQMRDRNRHSLWRVDSVLAAHALAKTIQKHPLYQDIFGVINIAGNVKKNSGGKYANSEAESWVKETITEKPWNTRTITITYSRLTVGASVPAWSAVLFLSDMSSPAEYMQTLFRCQTPCHQLYPINDDNTIFGLKDIVQVYDFSPNRMFKVITEAIAPNADSDDPQEQIEARDLLTEFLDFAPVLAFDGKKITKVHTDNFMSTLYKKYAATTVRDKFITPKLYNLGVTFSDELSKLLTDIQATFGRRTKEGHKKNHSPFEPTGLSDRDRRKLQEKRPKDRTPAENAALREEKKNRDKMVGTLNTLSARIPLLAAFSEKPCGFQHGDITPENFTSLVDDRSWEEFMPKGFTKESWGTIKELYNREVFRQSVAMITRYVEQFQNLDLDMRLVAMYGMFTLFADPDNESVLTPAGVVSRQLSQAFGGLRVVDNNGQFYVRNIENEIITVDFWDAIDSEHYAFEPQWTGVSERFVEGGATEDYWVRDDTTFFEPNSKTALYPLYMAHSAYYAKKKQREKILERELYEYEKLEIYQHIVENQVFANSRVPYSATIFKSVLAGGSDTMITNQSVVDIGRIWSETIHPNIKESRKKANGTGTETIYNMSLASKVMQFIFGKDSYNFGTVEQRAKRVMWTQSKIELKALVERVSEENGKFDFVISNPPYQIAAGGRSHQIYADFFFSGMALGKNMSMIFPMGWQKSTGRASGSSLHPLMRDTREIIYVDNYYEDSKENPCILFPTASTGGVNIVLTADNHDNSGEVDFLEYGKFVEKRDLRVVRSHGTETAEIFKNVKEWMEKFNIHDISPSVSPRGTHLPSSKIFSEPEYQDFISIDEKTGWVKCYGSTPGQESNYGTFYIDPRLKVLSLKTGEKHDAALPAVIFGVAAGTYAVYRKPILIPSGEVYTAAFIGIHCLPKEMNGILTYLQTYFYRFLLSGDNPVINTFANKHENVPDLSTVTNPRTGLVGYESDWTDDDLRILLKDYLTDDDWRHIKATAVAVDGKSGNGDYEAGYELPKPFGWDEVFPDKPWNGKRVSLTLDRY